MEAICSSETSIYTTSTRRHIPEDGILQKVSNILITKSAFYPFRATKSELTQPVYLHKHFTQNSFVCFTTLYGIEWNYDLEQLNISRACKEAIVAKYKEHLSMHHLPGGTAETHEKYKPDSRSLGRDSNSVLRVLRDRIYIRCELLVPHEPTIAFMCTLIRRIHGSDKMISHIHISIIEQVTHPAKQTTGSFPSH
jgi:hypothetical protein